MIVNARARLIVLSIILVVGLSGLSLTISHGLHAMPGSPSPATSISDPHCDAVSCSTSLPVWLALSLVILAPIGWACLEALLPIASIALPRLDPPPRFIA